MFRIDRSEAGKHLRLTHFTLVISCLGVLAVLSTDTDTDEHVAFEQFKEIEKVITNWDQAWLVTYTSKTVGVVPSTIGIRFDGDDLKTTAPDVYEVLRSRFRVQDSDDLAFSVNVQKWTLFGHEAQASLQAAGQFDQLSENGSFWERAVTSSGRGVVDFRVDRPQSLAEFRVLWGILGTLDKVYVVNGYHNTVQFVSSHKMTKAEITKSWAKASVTSTRDFQSNDDLVTGLTVIAKEKGMSGDGWQQIFANWPKKYAIWCSNRVGGYQPDPMILFYIPVSTNVVQFPLAPRVYLGRNHGVDWDDQDYSTVFPELSRATNYIEDIPMSNLRSHLRAKTFETQERFTVLGLGIPASVVSSWGTVLLFGLQIYFLLHLRAFIHTKDVVPAEKGHVPWIGFYGDPLSRIAYATTAILLPCLTILSLLIYELRRISLIGASMWPWEWPLRVWIPAIVLTLVVAVAVATATVVLATWRADGSLARTDEPTG